MTNVRYGEFIPVEGRNVVYQIAPGVYRPAQIVKVWSTTEPKPCDLVVFIDGLNDAQALGLATPGRSVGDFAACPVLWKTSVVHGTGVGQYLARKPQ